MFILFPEDGGGGTANPTGGNDVSDGLQPNDPNGEGTTHEEVTQVLKSSGINLPAEPTADADAEEGDDPDTSDESEADESADTSDVTEDADAEESDESEEEDKSTDEEEAPEAEDTTNTDDKYSFEIEDANGVTFKVPVGAKMEDILKDFEPKNNGQILDILDQLRDMKDRKAYDDRQESERLENEARDNRVKTLQDNWSKEVTDLQAQKRIPEGDDGDKRVSEVYKYMGEENEKRIKAGKPTLQSFEDAFDKLEARETREKAAAAVKAEKDEARKKGSLVGGSSAPATNGAPVYRPGARNANEALRAMNML